jgi:2-methylfumaryl-CoA hydratase
VTEKTNRGNYFEDFTPGTVLRHAVPRTLTEADNAVYIALTGDRQPLFCSDEFARQLGYPRAPLNDLLVFHTVFGKSVPDVSLNAVANLGYADVRFLRPVFPGDTLRAESSVLGRRETSAGNAGIVWVHTTGFNQRKEPVLSFYRWVMVHKRTVDVRPPGTAPVTGASDAPEMPAEVAATDLSLPDGLDVSRFDQAATGGRWYFDDYVTGERIHHADGMTIEESEHASATRLYQNTARLHFNLHMQQADPRFGRRLMYGGHVISIARALAFNGLENALGMLAWNGGAHANPTFAGDTLYAWTDVLDTAPLPNSPHAGALRLRLVAVKNLDPLKEDVPLRITDARGRETYHPNVVLDLDYWALMPRRDA